MSFYGIEVRDGQNRQILSMDDFTIQKLAVMFLPAVDAVGKGVRSDYILMDVPGYDPANGFVLITPKAYAPMEQNGGDSWGVVPTYRELGGSRIAIYTYVNRRRPTGVGNDYIEEWTENICETVVEVVRVR
ncbi:hypothetical protein [Pseudomonas entomophila]|uniref:hypothetical protein n=1 Tax=Pseudomonas entomophila TaxID=312306 RepID=UPI003EBC92AB